MHLALCQIQPNQLFMH